MVLHAAATKDEGRRCLTEASMAKLFGYLDERIATMTGPLEGIRIVEIGSLGLGPFAGMMLTDHGAGRRSRCSEEVKGRLSLPCGHNE